MKRYTMKQRFVCTLFHFVSFLNKRRKIVGVGSVLLILILSRDFFVDIDNEAQLKQNVGVDTKLKHQSHLKHVVGSKKENQCGLYMATSSEPGAGMGIFTANAVSKGNNISPINAPSIVLIDPPGGQKTWSRLLRGYWWGRGHGVFEDVLFEAQNAVSVENTLSGLPNAHPYLYSMNSEFPDITYDDSLLGGKRDPGAGAFSYHRSRLMQASRDIEAGEELFLRYPSAYYNNPWMQSVPRYDDYVKAGKMLFETKDMLNSLLPSIESKNDEAQKKKLEKVLKIIQKNSKSSSKRVSSLMPQTIDDLKLLVKNTKKIQSAEDMSLTIAKELSVDRRSISWLRENGLCLDNLQAAKSTLPQAGLGAFAQRSMSKGEIIIPVPLLQIEANKTDLQYVFSDDNHDFRSTQILINYCFGNKKSKLLLCPLTSATLINHCSQRQKKCGKNGPNAEIRWSGDWDKTNQEWLKKSYDELTEDSERGLSFEVVALRDIDPDEEVFIDYGEGWEKAWDEHVANWKLLEGFEASSSVKIMNDEMKPIPLKSSLTHLETYDADIITACVYWKDEKRNESWEAEADNKDWPNLSLEKLMAKYSSHGRLFDIEGKISHAYYWPCNVIGYNEKDDTYNVRIFQSHFHTQAVWDRKNLPCLIRKYPRTSIRYFHDQYTSDQHLPNAFRHYLEIDDDMFPKRWKNIE